MPVSSETLRMHWDYSTWATNRLLNAAAGLTPGELTRDFGSSEKSVLGTLAHVYAADRVWLGRIHGNPARVFITDEDRDLAVLQREWPQLCTRWSHWLAGLSDEDVLGKCSYYDLKGNPYTTPLWQIVLHVVNHGTHHRGQVQGFLRAMGKVPQPLDLIAYYRELVE